MPTVSIFGGADRGSEDSLYADALAAAAVLAEGGCGVATGGYGGIMEAASRGARQAGGQVLGVTSPVFQESEPNDWIGEVLTEEDLFTRTRRLIHLADAFLVYPGRSGTLSEVFFVWALVRARQAPPRPVALVGERWGRLLEIFVREDILEERVRRGTALHTDGPSAARWLLERLAGLEASP